MLAFAKRVMRMRQVLQSLKTGEIEVVTAPAPVIRPRHVLIETRRTLISAGTERMLLEFGKGNLIEKALQQPDKVKQTLQKVKTDGLSATVEAVRSKLDAPIALGYCNAGIVREVGSDVSHVKPGDRVASNGPHAELVVISRNLVAKIPDNVADDHAAFTPLASIALQGCRLAQPALGETYCVMGLGLVGLLAVQLLRSHGCRVIGSDFSKARLDLAKSWGAETVDLSANQDPVSAAMALTGGNGVDGVLVAASTKSNDPISQAAQMCRKRGKIVLVGVTGLALSREDFYEKELSFQVSCSYGPGRYDSGYEERGEDYPFGFVRWTEQRNFEAILTELSEHRLDLAPLISTTVDIADAGTAYNRLSEKSGDDLGLLISYPENAQDKFATDVSLSGNIRASKPSSGTVALIGAGGFGGRVTAPGLKAAGATLKTIVSRGGTNSVIEGRKAGFKKASTDIDATLADPDIDTIVIATRHDSHAHLTQQALRAGKHVFVEKPLALTEADVDATEQAFNQASEKGTQPHLMIGFNRRFSPFSIRMKELLDSVREPKCLVALINAGAIPADHWTQDPVQGGGRIIGEACHFIDLARYFVGAPITAVQSTQITRPTSDGIMDDKATITLSFEDGSTATVHYFANGPKDLVKERYEAFAGGKFLRLDNFKRLEALGWQKGASMKGRQDKGHEAALQAFIGAIKNGTPTPIAPSEAFEVSRWSIKAARPSTP